MAAGTRVRNGVIYACVNFSSQVWALSLADKKMQAQMQLPQGFCNDLTFDDQGNLFVTVNSSGGLSDVIYKLPATSVQTGGQIAASAWKAWHTSAAGADSLNGLVYSNALGKLLWAQSASIQSAMTTADTASAQTEITLPTGWNVDGMQLTAAGNLLVVADARSSNTAHPGAQLIQLSTGTKGTISPVTGGADCSSTLAIVGDDAFCTTTTNSSHQAIEKVVRLAAAGKL